MSGAKSFTIVVTPYGAMWKAIGLDLTAAGRTPYEAVRNWNFELAEESKAYVIEYLEDHAD